jgi:hypothetical protein
MIATACPIEMFIETCRDAFDRGEAPPEPETAAELQAFCREWPHKAWMFRPADESLRLMAVSKSSVDPVQPLPKDWRERLVVTLAEDRDFRDALAALLTGEGGRLDG